MAIMLPARRAIEDFFVKETAAGFLLFGAAERFIQTALRDWAYARAYPHIRPPR
jgi:hypothetical protein